jgi:hypothetical protein
MAMKKVPKSSNILNCEICHYSTSRKSQYIRHLSTAKHKNNELAINGNNLSILKSSNEYLCQICQNKYKDYSGLWKHKKKCLQKEEPKINQDDLIKYLMKENSDMKNLVLEVCQKIQPTINNTNTNSNNKTFNLNIFLNEECKDAMNIMDFVDSLKLQLEDLENVGKTGFVDGISNIIVKNLKALDVNKRPVHCSDIKREVLYVKDENKWEKENEEHNKMKKVIHQITHKNIKQIPEWVSENPLCKDSSSTKNDEYMKLLSNSMSGDGQKEQETNMNKIISKVAKEVIIEKV